MVEMEQLMSEAASHGVLPISDRETALQRVLDEERTKGFLPQVWLADGQDTHYFYFASLEGGMASVLQSDGKVVFGSVWPR